MSLLRRKPSAATREFESWAPGDIPASDPSAAAVPAIAKPGGTRTSQKQLEAAVEALNAAAARRG
jgi:hypothetical protein